MTIDLALNEAQTMLQNTARAFCENRVDPGAIRAWEESDKGFSREIWREMAQLGWTGITAPESYGGAGGSLLDLYPVCVELGRSLLPAPLLESSVVAFHTILAAGTDAQRASFLTAIATGDLIAIPALIERSGGLGALDVELDASTRGTSVQLNGVKMLVPYASSADVFLVTARDNGSGEISVWLVPAGTPGLIIEALPNTPGLPLAAVTFDNCSLDVDARLGEGAWQALEQATLRAGVLQAGYVIGAGEQVLEMTSGYAKDRVQFGSPIGRHQAVQYLVSDILIDLQRLRLFTLNAAWRIDSGLPWEREAARAKAFASRAAAHMVRQAHEVHAGVAFILDHDLQLYSRRAKYWEFNFGDARYHEERMLAAAGL